MACDIMLSHPLEVGKQREMEEEREEMRKKEGEKVLTKLRKAVLR